MNQKSQEYINQGYFILEKALSSKKIKQTLDEIKTTIKKLSDDIGVRLDMYLRAVSRWNCKSIVTHIAKENLLNQIQDHLQRILKEEVILIEASILCKNQYSNGSIPIHQDISYSKNNPYDFSVWVPLLNITNKSGGLSIIPKSHKNIIEPAVDFWSPNFINVLEYMCFSPKNLITLNLSISDMVVFNSILKHGSKPNILNNERFVFVTRWQKVSNKGKNYPIPEPDKAEFGIWNCHTFTEKSLRLLPTINTEDSFLTILDKWLDFLNANNEKINFINSQKTILSLQLLKILHIASKMHDGGDSQGIVYKSVYNHLLLKINKFSFYKELDHGSHHQN